MTLQFRSRLKSVVDYSSDVADVGVCCEHNVSPDFQGEEYTSYLSTANKCYSDQGPGSYVTRTFYPGIKDPTNFNCLKGSSSGCCCSCLYARQSAEYQSFLTDNDLFPVDTKNSDDDKCNQYEYDLKIALHPEVGLKNNVPQCECGRIGGVWNENACPILVPGPNDSAPTEDPDDNNFKYYYWYHDGSSWIARPETGINSKVELIKTKCYKSDTLYFDEVDDPPGEPLGTCCLGPAINGDLACYFELVTEAECEILACDSKVTGQSDCVSSTWNDVTGDAVDCQTCFREPVTGKCCPDINSSSLSLQDFAFESTEGIPATQCGPDATATGELIIVFDTQTQTYIRQSAADIDEDGQIDSGNTCPTGYIFKEAGNCADCTYKGQCCNKQTYACMGWMTRQDCINAVGGNPGNMNWVSKSGCVECDYGPDCCNFPTGRCCIDVGDTIQCNENYYKAQCDINGGQWGGPNSVCSGSNPCGSGLCCNYNTSPVNQVPVGCNQGYTEQSCCGTVGCNEDTGLKFVIQGDCVEECNFEKGICCSTLNDGVNKVCHGHITEQQCYFIRDTGIYLDTVWNNYYKNGQCVESGCSNIPRTLGVCCQDGATPRTTGTNDGNFETCTTNPYDQSILWTEVDCLYQNVEGEAIPYTNRQWNSAADTCDVCTSQLQGFCCDYVNNTCEITTQSTCCGANGCLPTPVDNDTGKYWSASFSSCDQCNIKGRCCYAEEENTTVPNIKTLRGKCKTGITKTECEQNYRGFWNASNTCDSNACQWGTCCVTANEIKSCYVTTSGQCTNGTFKYSGSPGWDYSLTPITSSELGQGPAPRACGVWTPVTFTNPSNGTGIAYSQLNCVQGIHNCPNVDLIDLRECANCNFICNYSGAFCNFKDCSTVTCNPVEPTCQCFNGTYHQYLNNIQNSKNDNGAGAPLCGTWYGNQATNCSCEGCQSCNSSLGFYSLSATPESINETPPNNRVTFKLIGTNLNPTIGSSNFGYTLVAVTPNFDFNADIDTTNSDPQTGIFTINPSTGRFSDEISFTSTDDSVSEGGDEIFKIQTQVGTELLEKQCTIFDDSLAPEFYISYEGPHGSEWNYALCEICLETPGVSYTNLILDTNNVVPGKTYYWGLTYDRYLGTDFNLNNKLLNLNNFVGITGTTGIATIGSDGNWSIGLTLRNDFRQETKDKEPITFKFCISDSLPYQGGSPGLPGVECYGGQQVLSLVDDGRRPKYGVFLNAIWGGPNAESYIVEGSESWNEIQISVNNLPPGTTWFYKIYGTDVTSSDFITESGDPFGLTGIITCNMNSSGEPANDPFDYYMTTGSSIRFRAVSDAVETPDEGFTFGIWPGSNEYYYYQADGTTFYFLSPEVNPFADDGTYPNKLNVPLYYPGNPWNIPDTRPMIIYPPSIYDQLSWPDQTGLSDSCTNCMVRIVELISFELGISGSTGYSTSFDNYVCEGSKDYFLSLKTVNFPNGATFPFKILSPGITGAGLTGFGGSDNISPWQNGNGFTGMFTIYVPPGGNTGYDVCKFKINYNLLTDETGSSDGKTFSIYLLPEVNRGITGVTSGIIDVYNCNYWQAQTPSINLTSIPFNGTDATIGEDPQSATSYPIGVTFTLKTVGFDPFNTASTSYGGFITGTGASASNQINFLITPAAGTTGLTYSDFDTIVARIENYNGSSITTRTYNPSTNLKFAPNIFGVTFPASASPGSNLGQGGITCSIYFKVKDDKFKDRDPCQGTTSENFTFSIAPAQNIRRTFAPTDFNIPTLSRNVKIIENSLPPGDFTIYAYQYNSDTGQYSYLPDSSNVPEGTKLEFRLNAKNVCLGDQYLAKIEGVQGFDANDIDFEPNGWTNITSANFGSNPQTPFYFVMGEGTYDAGRTSSNTIKVKIKDDGVIDPNGNDEGIKVSSFYTPSSSFPNYSVIIRVQDTGDPTPTGRCCSLATNPFCQEGIIEQNCNGDWTEGETCPTVNQCISSTPILGVPEIASGTVVNGKGTGTINPGSLFTGMNSGMDEDDYQLRFTYDNSDLEQCSACCGYEKIYCCLPNTGDVIGVCKLRGDASTTCQTYGGTSVPGPDSPCALLVTCCDDFTNTCSIVDQGQCTGLFKREVTGQDPTCVSCNFPSNDPSCTPPSEFDSIEWNTTIPDHWATIVSDATPIGVNINAIEYACRMDICCKGDGTGCSKVYWNYNANGTRILEIPFGSSCNQTAGDVLLSQELRDATGNLYIPKCLQYGARTTQRWQQQSGEDIAVDFNNYIKPNAPQFGKDCYLKGAMGVCCKFDLTLNDGISCAGSRTSRSYCYNKNTGTNQHRWLSSRYECTNIQVQSSADANPVSIQLPKYDCDICNKLNIPYQQASSAAEVKEEKYFYPGYFKDGNGITRDRNPGTLPGSVIMNSCEGCLDSPAKKYKDYFTDVTSTSSANKFAGNNSAYYSNLQYYSKPDNFSAVLNPNTESSTEQTCCNSFTDSYQNRSNFLTPIAGHTTRTQCPVCSNPTCICNYRNSNQCPNFDFSDCEDGGPGDPYGRCCVGGQCNPVNPQNPDGNYTQRDCAAANGVWGGSNTTCANVNGGPPCDLGACCNGDVDTGGTCTNNVIRANCSQANFNFGKQCGVVSGGILTCASEPRVTCCYSESPSANCQPNIRSSLCPNTAAACNPITSGTVVTQPKGTTPCGVHLCSALDVGRCCTTTGSTTTCAVKTRGCCTGTGQTFTAGGNCNGTNPCNVAAPTGRCCYNAGTNPIDITDNTSCPPCKNNLNIGSGTSKCCQCLEGKTKAECDALINGDSQVTNLDGNTAWLQNATCTGAACSGCEKRKKCTACNANIYLLYEFTGPSATNDTFKRLKVTDTPENRTLYGDSLYRQLSNSDLFSPFNIIWKIVSHDSVCSNCNTTAEFAKSPTNICWNNVDEPSQYITTVDGVKFQRYDVSSGNPADFSIIKCCNAACRPQNCTCKSEYFSGVLQQTPPNSGLVSSGGSCGELFSEAFSGRQRDVYYMTDTDTPQLISRTLPT